MGLHTEQWIGSNQSKGKRNSFKYNPEEDERTERDTLREKIKYYEGPWGRGGGE